MKIVVVGGSGLIGTKLVDRIRHQGHEVVAASPKSGINTITGEGLAEALGGAQVVVDVTNIVARYLQAVGDRREVSGTNDPRRKPASIGAQRTATRCSGCPRQEPDTHRCESLY